MIEENCSGCVVRIRSRIFEQWFVKWVGCITIFDSPKGKHVFTNSDAALLWPRVEARSDQGMDGKLKSPKSKIGMFWYIFVTASRVSWKSGMNESSAFGGR